MILKIVTSEDKLLRTRSKEIKKVDKKIKNLIKNMKDTLLDQKDPEGVGLAGPQVGKNIRLFVMRKMDNSLKAIINPKVISKSKKEEVSQDKGEILEGCLSVPYLYGPLKRAKTITIEFLDENGKKQKEKFEGFEATIVQHEIDHLEGTLFIDRLLKAKKPLYKLNEFDEWEEVDF